MSEGGPWTHGGGVLPVQTSQSEAPSTGGPAQ